jgi:N-acyl-D-amino-acid deacylase
MADIVISNGLIVDGSGSTAFEGDVEIEGDRIARIRRRDNSGATEMSVDNGREVIDATGLVVTPGFIDIHSHSDHTLLADPRAFSSLKQGVTLEVVGNCGFGCFPVEDPELARTRIYAFHDIAPITWKTASEYFDALQSCSPAVNVASLVPNGQLRLVAVGAEERGATGAEQRQMRRLLEQCLDDGAWGLSTCLESGEEISMTEDEVAELLRVVADANGVHATHTRDRADHAAEAIEEGIRTAERADCRLQVSHLIPDKGIDDLERCLAVVDSASERADVTFDMHTRLFGIGYLYAAVPPSLLQGSPADVAARLRTRETHEAAASFRSTMSALGDWNRIILLDNEVWPEYGRRSIAEIADERHTSPHETICELLAATSDDLDRLWVLELTFTEEEQRAAFVHPLCVPASDAAALAQDGPLAQSSFHGAYSWASWFYRYMVRDSQLLSREAAIHKLTGQPAKILGLSDRGIVAEGAHADLAVFDPAAFCDRETMFDPNQAAVGMVHVFVNGRPALRDGELTGHRAGKVLRHS